jgi:hypothetical protein
VTETRRRDKRIKRLLIIGIALARYERHMQRADTDLPILCSRVDGRYKLAGTGAMKHLRVSEVPMKVRPDMGIETGPDGAAHLITKGGEGIIVDWRS